MGCFRKGCLFLGYEYSLVLNYGREVFDELGCWEKGFRGFRGSKGFSD